MSSALRQSLEALGVRLVEMADGAAPASGRVIDLDGVYARYLATLQADAILVRPDLVLFGSADTSTAAGLAQALLSQLQASRQAEPASQRIAA